MTNEEKLAALATRIEPDTASDAVLTDLLAVSAAMILNRMYPYGYTDTRAVPPRYEQIQIQLAVELFTQRGAEGQSNHSENGTSRSWPEKNKLLAQIVPHCGCVVTSHA